MSSAADEQFITDASSLADLASSSSGRPAQPRQLRRVDTAGESVPGSQRTQEGSQEDDLARKAQGLAITSPQRPAALVSPAGVAISQESAESPADQFPDVPLSLEEHNASVQGSQDSRLAAQAEGLSLALTVLPPANPLPSSSSGQPSSPSGLPQRLWCPVPNCRAAHGSRHMGFPSFGALRAHVNDHLLGTMPGALPDEWMQRGRWCACSHCGKLVSTTCNNGIHRRCLGLIAAAAQDVRSASANGSEPLSSPQLEVLDEIPDIHDICLRDARMREWLEPSLLSIAEPEFLRCLANVVEYNAKACFQPSHDLYASPDFQRSRIAWTEAFMFCKTCLPALPGGKVKAKRNLNITSTRLERWASGERRSRWDDIPSQKKAKTNRTPDPDKAKQAAQLAAIADTQHGLPGRAVNKLISSGLAPDTPEVEAKLRSKFVDPPSNQANSSRPPAPPSNELLEETVSAQILSFARGLGGGPSATRPDFIRQIVGDKGTKPGITIITRFCNLLANGDAPDELRPYLGGAVGHAGKKPSKDEMATASSTDSDIRPLCAGEYWRRLVGKCLLQTEMGAISIHLGCNQLAVGVRAGAEIMPHLARKWLHTHADDPD